MSITFTIGDGAAGRVTVCVPGRLDPSTGKPAVTASDLGDVMHTTAERALILAVAAQRRPAPAGGRVSMAFDGSAEAASASQHAAQAQQSQGGADDFAHALFGALNGHATPGLFGTGERHQSPSPGVGSALIDAELAGTTLLAELEEATMNEASSRAMAALVRDAPAILRGLAGQAGPGGLLAALLSRPQS